MNAEANQSHFEGQTPYDHIQNKRAQIASEIHGEEISDSFLAAFDAARETAIALMIIGVIISQMLLPFYQQVLLLGIFSLGFLIWKISRSIWAGWSGLERLHRLVEEEKYEIEHHREQEREELAALYAAKGFEGKLLHDVVDVLMADDERLLRVMVEEELGLNVGVYEHPVKQGIAAGIGVLFSVVILAIGLFFIPDFGIEIAAGAVIAFTGTIISKLQKNALLPSFIWNIAITILAFGIVYFLMNWVLYLILS